MTRLQSLSVVVVLALLVAGGARAARAQGASAGASGFALDRFEPAGGGSRWFSLESLDFRGQGRMAAGLVGDWAWKPLVLFDENDIEQEALVRQQLFFHAVIAFNLVDRLRLGATLPLAPYQQGSDTQIGARAYAAPSGFNLGDVRLGADVALVGAAGDPFILAVGAQAFLPSGSRADYTGDGSVRIAPRVMVAGDAGQMAYAARVGFQFRSSIDRDAFQGVALGNELSGAVAVGLRPAPNLLVGPELFGSTVLKDGSFFESRATPVELLLGGRLTVAEDWHLGLGVSPGLTQGIGSPQFRVLAGVEYFPAVPPPDRDGDGILDDDDACPDEPGIRTGNPRTHGCPRPPDRDKDGIIDPKDACPTEPGPRSDDPRKNGCPPPPDRDKDGVLDADDACPDEAGVKTNDPKTNGCPPPADRDKDGIPDAEDACPDVAGFRTNDPKTNGCLDRDMDGIYDPEDACPDAAGPADPDPKKNGCPVARVEKGQIRILEQVKFKFNSAVILPESDPTLEAVAKIMKENPEIKKIRVEGHTDNRGTPKYNKSLSDRRAASVVKWLVQKGGVEASRLQSQGFGRDRPIATNKTEEGRAQNRRVEFHIADPPPGENP